MTKSNRGGGGEVEVIKSEVDEKFQFSEGGGLTSDNWHFGVNWFV